jgi:hypothetical protein
MENSWWFYVNCSNSHTLGAEGGVCKRLGENMHPWGGGLEKLYGREQGSLVTVSFLSFKVSSVWHLEPYETVTCVKGSQWTLSLMIFEVELGFGSMEDLFLVLVKILVSWGTHPTFSFKRSLRWQWYGGTNPSFRVERSLRRPCSETTKIQQKHY